MYKGGILFPIITSIFYTLKSWGYEDEIDNNVEELAEREDLVSFHHLSDFYICDLELKWIFYFSNFMLGIFQTIKYFITRFHFL